LQGEKECEKKSVAGNLIKLPASRRVPTVNGIKNAILESDRTVPGYTQENSLNLAEEELHLPKNKINVIYGYL
jgi:hypothetical protein